MKATDALRFRRTHTEAYEYTAEDQIWHFRISRGVRNWTLTITRLDAATPSRVECSTNTKRLAEAIVHEFRTLGPGYNPDAEGDPRRLDVAIERIYVREDMT